MGDAMYPGKLLLFGEYTVLNGSRALSVPLNRWQGKLMKTDDPDPELPGLVAHLRRSGYFDADAVDTFEQDVRSGLRFVSGIPQGYGAGSSGALCAAIGAKYFNLSLSCEEDVITARKSLAVIESYYHGESSGVDPLVSLTGAAILREQDQYHVLKVLPGHAGVYPFLIDSGYRRDTLSLVTQYRAWCAEETFLTTCVRPLVQSTDHAISFYLMQHSPMLWEQLHLISLLQFQYMRSLIAGTVMQLWESSLETPGISIKLCGAGGGGFYLGFTDNRENIEAMAGALDVV